MQTHSQQSRMRRQKGFNLVELMLTLTIAGILAGVAVPNMRDFMRNNRLSGVSNDLLRSMQVARTEAIKRQLAGTSSVVVCATADPVANVPVCGFAGQPFTAWVVFVDTNGDWQVNAGEAILERHGVVDPALTVRTDKSSVVSYVLTGFPNRNNPGGLEQTTTVMICDERGNEAIGVGESTARAVTIDNTGRTRVNRTKTTIDDILATNGALTCP